MLQRDTFAKNSVSPISQDYYTALWMDDVEKCGIYP